MVCIILAVNPLTINDAFCHPNKFSCMLSVLKIDFALEKKCGIEGGEQAYSRHAVHMAASLACCRTAMFGTGWTISCCAH